MGCAKRCITRCGCSESLQLRADLVAGRIPQINDARCRPNSPEEMNMPRNEGQSTLFFGPWYRKSPFFEATQRAGAKAYDIYNHMYLPGLYTDPFEEYWHLINHVTLWDVSVERQVEISGKDGAKFAELITPRDLTKCDVGQGKYVVITDENGGI